MAIESEAAEQSVGISLQVAEAGGRLAVSAAKTSVETVAKLLALIYRKVQEGKELTPGERKLKDLAKNGDNVHLFTAPDENVEQIHRALKEYGIPYAIVEQKYSKDEMIDIAVRERDAARAARALEKAKAFEEQGTSLIRKPLRTEPEDEEWLTHISDAYVADRAAFDEVIERIGGEENVDKEIVLCSAEDPDDYLIANTEKLKQNNRNVYSTTVEAYHNGEKQTCDEYRHGNFVRRTDAAGKNTSEQGEKHWTNVKNELKAKCHIGQEVLVFASREKYEFYAEQRKKEAAERNTEEFAKHFVEDVTVNPVRAKTEGADLSERGFRLRRRQDGIISDRRKSVKVRLRELRDMLRREQKQVPEIEEQTRRRKRGKNR